MPSMADSHEVIDCSRDFIRHNYSGCFLLSRARLGARMIAGRNGNSVLGTKRGVQQAEASTEWSYKNALLKKMTETPMLGVSPVGDVLVTFK